MNLHTFKSSLVQLRTSLMYSQTVCNHNVIPLLSHKMDNSAVTVLYEFLTLCKNLRFFPTFDSFHFSSRIT